MKTLPPIHLKDEYYAQIEREINRIFFDLIYAPLLAAIGATKKEITNSKNPLIEALETGAVWYQDGKFRGTFNAKISKELRKLGATFDKRSTVWGFPIVELPPEIRQATFKAEVTYKTAQQNMLKALDNVNLDAIGQFEEIPKTYQKTVHMINRDLNKTINPIAIPPVLTEQQTKIIASEWGRNLDLYIKDWVKKDILDLRQKVQANAFQGYRSSNLIQMIQDNHGVSVRKAKFLARQETTLLMSKFRESKYADVGITKYIWRGAMDERERPDHKRLQGKVFDFSLPPVVDRKTGRRANAGEDFGCRCVAIPVIE